MRNDSHSGVASPEYRANYDKIFGKKTPKDFQKNSGSFRIGKISRIHDNENLQSLSLGQPDESKWPEEIERIRKNTGIEVKFNRGTGAMVLPNRAAQLKVAKYLGFVVD